MVSERQCRIGISSLIKFSFMQPVGDEPFLALEHRGPAMKAHRIFLSLRSDVVEYHSFPFFGGDFNFCSGENSLSPFCDCIQVNHECDNSLPSAFKVDKTTRCRGIEVIKVGLVLCSDVIIE